MRAVFEPRGWTVNRVDIDYGTDFEVEVFRDFKSTGVAFKVQLKSSEATQYSTDKEFVSQPLDSRNAIRLSKELRSPVILIHADCRNRRTFWSAPQLDTRLSEMLSRKGAKSITVRIPTASELPATIDGLIRTVTQTEQVLASRMLIATPVIDFIDSIEGRVDENALLQAFKNKSDAIKLLKAQDLLVTGSLNEARITMQKVVDDSESSIESKFWAVLWLERVEFIALVKANAPQELWSRADLNTSMQLQNLTKKGPSHLKFFALISLRAAELHRLVHRDYGLYLNWKLHEKGADLLWKAQLAFERAHSFRSIVKKYNQCIRLVRYAVNSKDRWALSQAILRIVRAISPFMFRLSGDKENGVADRYSASTLELCRFAAWIAEHNDDDDSLYFSISAALLTKRDTESEAWSWARETVKQIKKENVKAKAQETLDNHARRVSGEVVDGDIKASARQVYENMAAALGIDLSDPSDPEANIVRIGINDLDPSRVLRNCEHLFLSLGFSRPMIADILSLPSAGTKILHCTLHQYSIEGLALDGIYGFFKKRFCDPCSDCSPRPSGWEYSDKWQMEENSRHIEFMNEFKRQVESYADHRHVEQE